MMTNAFGRKELQDDLFVFSTINKRSRIPKYIKCQIIMMIRSFMFLRNMILNFERKLCLKKKTIASSCQINS